MNIRKTSFVVAFVSFFAFAGPVSAQNKWGVQVSVTPSWNTLSALEGPVFGASDEPWDRQNPINPNLKALLVQRLGNWVGAGTDVGGSDITVGVVRGSVNGGEWGVSYVRRNIDDSSRIENLSMQCFDSSGNFCVPRGDTYELHSVSMNGAEAYKFLPLFRVNRVQLGVTLAGGVAKMSGTVTERALAPFVTAQTSTQIAISTGYTVQEITSDEMLKDLDVSRIFPLVRAELTVAVPVTSTLKVKAGGGFNFPATSKISVGVTYLF